MSDAFSPVIESSYYTFKKTVPVVSGTPSPLIGANANRTSIVLTNGWSGFYYLYCFTPWDPLVPDFSIEPGASLVLRFEDYGAMVGYAWGYMTTAYVTYNNNVGSGKLSVIEVIYQPVRT
jgi:hypothetical protein